jgi:hypothetical protein
MATFRTDVSNFTRFSSELTVSLSFSRGGVNRSCVKTKAHTQVEYVKHTGDGRHVEDISKEIPMTRQPAAVPNSATCQQWRCTCQGYSDTFGTYPNHWGLAKGDVRSWWVKNRCDAHPQVVKVTPLLTTTIIPTSTRAPQQVPHMTFAIGIPAMYSELGQVQRAVCAAWRDQTVPPDEVVVAISAVPPGVTLPWINATVVVSSSPRFAGWARNQIADNTQSEWILFHDVDDGMYPDRVEITRQAVKRWPHLQIIAHKFSKTLVPVAHPNREWKWVSGNDIWHKLGGNIRPNFAWTLTHGHPAVKTAVVRKFRYSEAMRKGEDFIFFWDAVKKLNDTAAVTILNFDLSAYVPREIQAATPKSPAPPTPEMFKSSC